MRTCVHHGEEIKPGRFRCSMRTDAFLYCIGVEDGSGFRSCFVPMPAAPAPEAEVKVPDSTQVTFADVLRYHRRRAQARDGDPAWHAEAAECLRELAGYLGEVCRPCTGVYDGEVCQRARCPIWRARKAVEVEG